MLPSVEYIKTLVNGLKQWVENRVENRVKSVRKELTDKIEDLPQADWDQNDPEAKDYVKNRPCYTVTELASTTNPMALIYSDAYSVVAVSFDENEKLKIVSAEGSQPYIYTLENGDQFEVKYNSGTGFYVSSKPEGVNTVYFWYENQVVTQLPDEYIPDWVHNKADKVVIDWLSSGFVAAGSGTIANRPNVFMHASNEGIDTLDLTGDGYIDDRGAIYILYPTGAAGSHYPGAKRIKYKTNSNYVPTHTVSIKSLFTNRELTDADLKKTTMLAVALFPKTSRDDIASCYALNIPADPPFQIDSTASEYSTTSTTYGDEVKTALLDGRDVWYIGTETDESGKTVTKYTKVSWFNIEKTDTEAKLIVGVGARTDDNSGAVTFAISV